MFQISRVMGSPNGSMPCTWCHKLEHLVARVPGNICGAPTLPDPNARTFLGLPLKVCKWRKCKKCDNPTSTAPSLTQRCNCVGYHSFHLGKTFSTNWEHLGVSCTATKNNLPSLFRRKRSKLSWGTLGFNEKAPSITTLPLSAMEPMIWPSWNPLTIPSWLSQTLSRYRQTCLTSLSCHWGGLKKENLGWILPKKDAFLELVPAHWGRVSQLGAITWLVADDHGMFANLWGHKATK